MNPRDKMLLKVFKTPIAVFVSIPFVYAGAAWYGGELSTIPMLAQIGEFLSNAAGTLAAAVLTIATTMTAWSAWELRRWQMGTHPGCRECGGFVIEKTRGRRVYHECLLCNCRTRLY
jgi:ABC-type sulfate transport system permease component